EFKQRAAARRQVVIPATVLLIFVLLYMNFGNASAPALVMLSLPFALTGGFWLVYWLDFNLSVAVAVGFIALAGIAVEIGVLVVAFIREAVERQRRERVETGQPQLSRGEILDAVREGTASRLRPVAMTTFSTVIGLLPVMLLSDTGSDVMQRIAAPMVGGLLSTAALSLLVLPVVYSFGVELHEWRVRRGAVQQHESPVLID
ncbi:MAG: efflux RND transporter permease subunit, partial [Pseudomonadales bacterium]|nr:efflux RND transporter permease subunit [Pseudomonadales bacterium]